MVRSRPSAQIFSGQFSRALPGQNYLKAADRLGLIPPYSGTLDNAVHTWYTPRMETIRIAFRAHRSLKQAVEQTAAANDETLSQVLRRAMRDYIAAHAQLDLPTKPIGRPRKVQQ